MVNAESNEQVLEGESEISRGTAAPELDRTSFYMDVPLVADRSDLFEEPDQSPSGEEGTRQGQTPPRWYTASHHDAFESCAVLIDEASREKVSSVL